MLNYTNVENEDFMSGEVSGKVGRKLRYLRCGKAMDMWTSGPSRLKSDIPQDMYVIDYLPQVK